MSTIRHSGLTRPGGSTSSSDSSSTPSPATASISARVSVQGGSVGVRLVVATDDLDDERPCRPAP